ncbi:prostate stem cell antigen-like [Pseudorasbora parva]|uniref:prostate stem cell antigen-like n=1 Tax=Pseudorasbora parva TaxID=51549 RepID=UPI00351F697D
MDLRVSFVLLLIFLTGGYSLKCYSCRPDITGACAAKEETCSLPHNSCATTKVEASDGSSDVSYTVKGCTTNCELLTKRMSITQTVTFHCCDTDLCNAADGVYKGSFLLLLSPLLFYFLFQ